MKYADDLVLLAKEEKVLQDMIDKLVEFYIHCGNTGQLNNGD
jgi:hypothetical protein